MFGALRLLAKENMGGKDYASKAAAGLPHSKKGDEAQ